VGEPLPGVEMEAALRFQSNQAVFFLNRSAQ
jgi:hypothetical protein